MSAGRLERRFRAAFTVVRDVATTAGALWGVWHQESSGDVKPWLLGMYAVMLSLIPASHMWALVRAPAPEAGPSSSTLPPAPATAPLPPL